MCKIFQMTMCDTQGQLFALASTEGYNSEAFIKTYMTSHISKDIEKDYNHLQWAGKAYILSKMEDELGSKLFKDNDTYDSEVLYWIGYIYRYWNYYTGESSKEIYKQASAKTMKSVYYSYHTMSPQMAIDRLKETYLDKIAKK